MRGNRDDIVSVYVRKRIEGWRESGREMQELARIAGFAKSTPSQVMAGTGVGQKTGPGFAKAFGFRSFDDLRVAAFEWWLSEHGGVGAAAGHQAQPSDALREAADLVVHLGQGTPEQVASIMDAYAHPRFADRPRDWWVQVLLAELARDRAGQDEVPSTRRRSVAPPPGQASKKSA